MTTYFNASSVESTVRTIARLAIRPGTRVWPDVPIPFSTRSFIPDDAVVVNGWPTVPEVWVHTNSLVSWDGSHYDSTRPDPFSVPVIGDVRFIASDANYNPISGIWSPYYSQLIDYTMLANIASPPLLNNLSYLVGKEMITTGVFQFVPGARMDSKFNSGFDQTQNVGVAAVMRLHMGDYPILSIPDPAAPGTDLVSIDYIGGLNLRVKNPSTGVVSVYPLRTLQSALSMVPLFLILLYIGDEFTLLAGSSMSAMTMLTVSLRAPILLPMDFTFGSDIAVSDSSFFYLMDLVIFDPEDLTLVTSTLTSIYAGTT